MLNPAWQPAQRRAERLIHISHLFLSDGAAATAPAVAAEPMQLPVLLAVADLPGAPEADYLLGALARQLNLPGAAAGQTWHLYTYSRAEAVPPSELILLVVDASLEATRDAYALLKQLHPHDGGNIGVIYRAGDDLAAARRCYRRLAVAAIRFLNQPLVNLGWLPNPGPHFAAALAHAAQVIHSQRRHHAVSEVVQ